MSETFSPDTIKLVYDAIQSQVAANGRTNAETVYSSIAIKLNPPTILTAFKVSLGSAFKTGLFPGYTTKVGRYGGIVRADASSTLAATSNVVGSSGIEPIVVYETVRTKPLSELRAADVPRGLDPEDVALPEPTAPKAEEVLPTPVETTLLEAGVSSKLLAKPDRPYLATTPKVVKPEPLRNVLYEPGAVFYMTIGEDRYKVPCSQIHIQTLLERVFHATEDANGEVEFMGKRYAVAQQKMLWDLLIWFLDAAICRGVVKKED